ncbi:MAG: DUF3108 domain-containing protein [Bdellovibrionales bacterium]|nr:DUF3108 domain-containing protein [Bdellovibrionales bacterium]
MDSPSMEEIRLKVRKLTPRFLGSAIVALALIGCASRFLQFDDADKVLQNKEFDSAIKVKELPPPEPTPVPTPVVSGAEVPPAIAPTPTPVPTPVPKGKKKGKQAAVPVGPVLREPRIEDDEGMTTRRPLIDPFKVGEEVTLDISYFGVDAGELIIQTLPFVEVNGRRAYRFRSFAKTVSVFEMFYKVDDVAETFVDYETLNPFSYTLDVKESKLLRDARALHDWQKGRMFYWDKKITKDSGVEEKRGLGDSGLFAEYFFCSLVPSNIQTNAGKKTQVPYGS